MSVCLYEIWTSQAIDKNLANSAVTKLQERDIKLKSKLVNSLKKAIR